MDVVFHEISSQPLALWSPVKSPALAAIGAQLTPAVLRPCVCSPFTVGRPRVTSKWPRKDRSGLGHGTYPSRFLFLTKSQLFSFVSSMLEKVPWQVM